MHTLKQAGIWMDHSKAHVIEFNNASADSLTIDTEFTHQEKEQSLSKSENIMHNKEQQKQGEYYKKIGEIIKGYDDVILFGPTDAKQELYNLIKDDQQFSKIKIEVQQSDKLTENQEQAFVRDHFSKQNNL